MSKILGLDLGTNSIGWAIVDKDNSYIIDSGVRIFPAGVKDIGQGDKEQSKNAERRQFRMARRLHFRKRLRKIKLLETLTQQQMCPLSMDSLKKWKNWDKVEKSAGRVFPSDKKFIEWLKMNPYLLREKAVKEPVTRLELGRIFYHFIQRRGFLSTRKGSDDGAIYTGKENVEGINATRKLIQDKTLGQQLNQYLPKEQRSYKRIIDENGKEVRVRARYTLRRMYVEEFERIWEKQATHLGLSELVVEDKKAVLLKGSSASIRNKRKIQHLKDQHGDANVNIKGNRIVVCYTQPFKQYLAGNIEKTEEGIRFKSNDSVLFWQRPLRSQKALLGKCTFESRKFFDHNTKKARVVGASPVPVSHPDFELFRAYQFINNIRFGSRNLRLNSLQRETVLGVINNEVGLFDFKKIPAALGLSYEKFNYDDDFKVAGNTTHKRIRPIFSEQQWNQCKYDIWHCFYFYDSPEMLAEKLQRTYGLADEKAQKASKLQLKEDYGSVSLKAIRNILPFLEMGHLYSTAVLLGGVRNAFGPRWDHFADYQDEIIQKVTGIIHDTKHKEYELITNIQNLLSDPENNYGFTKDDKAFRKLYHHSQAIEKKQRQKRISEIENLRNPIVQKGLQEMRRLVNELLDKYSTQDSFGPDFAFDRIHVELGRNLRSGKQQRRDMMIKIRDNEQANEDARARLAEYGLKPSRENITKFRLYREIEEKYGRVVCPYTNMTIKISDVLGSDNKIQIEHIVPYSVSLDDSFQNKTLCEANFNRLKGERTPYEFYQMNGDSLLWAAESWNEIERRAYALLPYGKARKFTRDKKLEKSEFIERQLNDTRYISKKAAEVLKEITDDVRVLPGQLTSELRRLWGLNNVVQTVEPLSLKGYKVDENKQLPHYVVIDENNKPLKITPIDAERPKTNSDQFLLPGSIDKKEKFVARVKEPYLKFEMDSVSLPEGKYWARLNVTEPICFERKFNEPPSTDELSIAYRGRVSKGQFVHNSLPRKIKADLEDGAFWVKLSVTGHQFYPPEKKNTPKTNKNQVLLYGVVNDGRFESYIYQCDTNLESGKYWAVLDVDFDSAEFTKAFNEPKVNAANELVVQGSVDDQGVFVADCDMTYRKSLKINAGKYFAIIRLLSVDDLFPLYNKPPDVKKGEKLLEGNVWVDKQSGEIKFDPKKSRNDHRHHAVDAITVALTEQTYLQQLGQYFGEKKEHEKGIGDRPSFDPPWGNFDKDVRRSVEGILVSHSRNSKVVSKISKTIEKNGKTYQSVGYAARGQLHREFYFGKYPGLGPGQVKPGIEQKNIDEQYFHRRKSLSDIKKHKHVNKIADPGIRKLIEGRLWDVFKIDPGKPYDIPAGFFFDSEKRPALFLPNKKGDPVPVKKVRVRERIGNAVQLKDQFNQWVNPYNNHHVVIYNDHNGDMQEQVVSFWEVVERVHQEEPIYKLPADGEEMIATLQENDMFLLGLTTEQVQMLKENRFPQQEISKHLYRVQKLSSLYYTFRHHLISGVDTGEGEWRIQSMLSWENANPQKVQLELTGEIHMV